jgi:two-component system phosphate regulon sensor histidine kinase PhoR
VRGGNHGYRVRVIPGREFSQLVDSFNRMTESIEAHIRTITDQKQQLEAILNGMREGVMVLDYRGRIQTTNRAMERIAPFVSKKIGRTPMEVIMNPELQAACEKVLSGTDNFAAQPYNLQISLERDRVYDINIVRLRDTQNRIGAILVFYDMGEIKRLEKIRQDFVANVSHELRTPLTSIKGYTETLLAEEQQDIGAMRPFLEVILKNANHMTKIVDDLLRLARLDARQQPMHIAPIDAAPVLLDAWEACAPLAEHRGVQLRNEMPEEGIQVSADADQLVQVFINLLENAIKYSPEGGKVAVSCSLKGGRATFGVNDEGPGIPKADQQRIFERFYRVERHRSIQPGSSGLGLAICRHIILNHGGRIWVESPPADKSAGSTFYFTLPAEQV